MEELVEIEYDEELHETPAARLFKIGDGKVWIPKSQTYHHDPQTDGTGSFEIPEWLAKEKELV